MPSALPKQSTCHSPPLHPHRCNQTHVAPRQLGFTIIELLVVITIMSLMFSMAAPAFSSLVQRYQVRGEVDQFISLLAVARQTAISKGVVVTVCPKHSSEKDRCGSRNAWHLGTLVFEDLNGNRLMDGTDALIAGTAPLEHNTVQWRAFRNRSYLRFNPTGLTDWQNGHFLFCPVNQQANLIRQLVLNYAGRTYLSEDNDGDGIHEDVGGDALSC